MKGEEEIGIRSNVRVEKSRFGPPYRECIMPIYYSDVKPHPLDVVIDAALSSKVLKSRSKTMENGEKIQTFTFGDIRVEGIDEFKKEMSSVQIKDMFEAVVAATKINFDLEVTNYIKSLENEDPAKVTVTEEGDPGA
jgi:hypothetical protein